MTMPNNVVDGGWTAEPELKEMPPRRLVAYEDYPDLNKPNLTAMLGIAGAATAGGLILLIIGLAGKNVMLSILGVVLALAGVGLGVFFQNKARSHISRAEHLVTTGMPVMARILSTDNLTGSSTYGRTVKYQVAVPGGEMIHKEVAADERVLPKRIPSDATALIDMQSGDVELYCVLPFRAISKTAVATPYTPAATGGTPSAPTPTADPLAGLPTDNSPATGPAGTMGSIGGGAVPVRRPTPEPAATQKQEQSQEQNQGQKKTGSSGLPWE
jgi:hypothetical protein